MKKIFTFSPFILLILPVIVFLLLSAGMKKQAGEEDVFAQKTASSVSTAGSGLLKILVK